LLPELDTGADDGADTAVLAVLRLTMGDDVEVTCVSRFDPTSIQLLVLLLLLPLSALLKVVCVGEFNDGFEENTAELRVATEGREAEPDPQAPEAGETVTGYTYNKTTKKIDA
jgi:hypothetical protein